MRLYFFLARLAAARVGARGRDSSSLTDRFFLSVPPDAQLRAPTPLLPVHARPSWSLSSLFAMSTDAVAMEECPGGGCRLVVGSSSDNTGAESSASVSRASGNGGVGRRRGRGRRVR
jgi:hypothetical protein